MLLAGRHSVRLLSRAESQGERQATSSSRDPLLLRVARGEGEAVSSQSDAPIVKECTPDDAIRLLCCPAEAERTPVWLMRQAGRYMAEFRRFSDRIGFRERSETAEIAIELSLQPWRAFRPDGVIMFSDILTPLPALGVEFDVVRGKGPVIEMPIRSMDQVDQLIPLSDPDTQLPFISTILSTLRQEIGDEATLLGFVGAPWTLAAYCIEGKADNCRTSRSASPRYCTTARQQTDLLRSFQHLVRQKCLIAHWHCMKTKRLMFHQPAILHALMHHLSEQLIQYISYQIQSGAQVVQLFESWAHHLSPGQFEAFAKDYAERVLQGVKELHPEVPLIYHANGGTGKLHLMGDVSADVVGLDWQTEMAAARGILGRTKVQGNIDPMVLFGSEDDIRQAVSHCIAEAGESGHILNVGHGVAQGTPEENVGLFCQLARESSQKEKGSLVIAA